jgi:chemotaxis protein CheX
MEPFIQAAHSVLAQLSEGCVDTGSLNLAGTTFPTANTNIAAHVDGSLIGDLVYSMSGSTARKLACVITGNEVREFGRMMRQGLDQLGVMLTEETRRILCEQGLECEIGAPIIFQGLNVEFAAAEPALSVLVDTNAGQLNVSVAVGKW